VQNRNIYTVKEDKAKDTKLRGLKGTNEDISISLETELKGTRQNRVKRYKETPVPKSKGTMQNSVKRYKETPVKLYTGEKPQSKVYTGIEKTPVQRHKKDPSPQVKRYKEESRLKGAKQRLCNSSYTSLPPPLHQIM
jgi:hypothetical protein